MPSRPSLDLGEYLPYLINRVGSALVVDFGRSTLARHRLSIAMWRVLAALSSDDGQRQIDLAAMTSIDVSTLSRVVTRLVQNGPGDAHAVCDQQPRGGRAPHRQGRGALARMIPRAIAAERRAIAGVPAKDLAVVRRSLRRMYANLAGSLVQAGLESRPREP